MGDARQAVAIMDELRASREAAAKERVDADRIRMEIHIARAKAFARQDSREDEQEEQKG